MTSANTSVATGGLLRAARKAAGFSQQRVAEMAGCSVSYVRMLESGYQPEHESGVLIRIADVLNDKSPVSTPGSRDNSPMGGRHDGSYSTT